MTENNYQCQECKDRGFIELLTSTVKCECQKNNSDQPTDSNKSFIDDILNINYTGHIYDGRSYDFVYSRNDVKIYVESDPQIDNDVAKEIIYKNLPLKKYKTLGYNSIQVLICLESVSHIAGGQGLSSNYQGFIKVRSTSESQYFGTINFDLST